MSNYVSIIFCKNCNSRYVEINDWDTESKSVIFHCRTCDVRETVKNFTLGRTKILDNELQTARETKAIPCKPER